MSTPRRLAVGIVILAATGIGSALVKKPGTGISMSEAASAFLDTLDDEQRGRTILPYDDTEKRTGWHFVPRSERKGLPLKVMDDAQRRAALALVRSALSRTGYRKATQIIALEGVLRALEGRSDFRDPERYYVTLFGKPSPKKEWGLSFEGHHLSLNFAVKDGEVISSTPTFLGANPGIVKKAVAGVEAGTRVLAKEEEVAFELLASLDPEQRKKAVVSDKPLREIRAPGAPQPPTDPPVGLPASRMTESQMKTLRRLVSVYAKNMSADVRAARLDAIERAGFEKTHFAWAGAERPGVGHYYRLQGPTFLVELVNTQPDSLGNPANHVHCVWRDLRGDFGVPISVSATGEDK